MPVREIQQGQPVFLSLGVPTITESTMTELRTDAGAIVLVLGDVTRQPVDAVVTAANAGLRGGGGAP